ncbi:hypothetical protein KCU67_g3051, partial [Aureobasidium melanogenum]
MKNHQIQQIGCFLALQKIAGSFLACGLSAVAIYVLLPAILIDVKFSIQHPEVRFATYSKGGRFIWATIVELFVVYLLLQKLVTSFRSSLLPFVKLAIDSFNAGNQDKKQARLSTECDEKKTKQQPATPQPREQAEFGQEYQAWRKQFETHIREDSKSTTLTYSPAPSPLLHENGGCIHCNQHIITFSDALQVFYSKTNLSDEDFNKDRMYWHILAEESNIKYNTCKISILKGRKEFMKRGLAAIANEVEQALFDLRGTEQED